MILHIVNLPWRISRAQVGLSTAKCPQTSMTCLPSMIFWVTHKAIGVGCIKLLRQWTTTGILITDIMMETAGKSSLHFLNVSSFTVDDVHLLWKTLSSNPREVVKARILIETHVLQANRAKFNQFEVDPSCQMCKTGAEDRLHFILCCQAHADVRQKYLLKLRNRLCNPYSTN